MTTLSPRAVAARARAAERWYVYLILCRSGAIYTGIARSVAKRYARHVAGEGARYTRANPPRRLLAKVACANQSEAGRMEAAIKKLAAIDKRKLVGKTASAVRKILFGATSSPIVQPAPACLGLSSARTKRLNALRRW